MFPSQCWLRRQGGEAAATMSDRMPGLDFQTLMAQQKQLLEQQQQLSTQVQLLALQQQQFQQWLERMQDWHQQQEKYHEQGQHHIYAALRLQLQHLGLQLQQQTQHQLYTQPEQERRDEDLGNEQRQRDPQHQQLCVPAYKVMDKVESQWRGDDGAWAKSNKWWPAQVLRVGDNNTYTIEFQGGFGQLSSVPEDRMRPLSARREAELIQTPMFRETARYVHPRAAMPAASGPRPPQDPPPPNSQSSASAAMQTNRGQAACHVHPQASVPAPRFPPPPDSQSSASAQMQADCGQTALHVPAQSGPRPPQHTPPPDSQSSAPAAMQTHCAQAACHMHPPDTPSSHSGSESTVIPPM